jgi:hypothetical protein
MNCSYSDLILCSCNGRMKAGQGPAVSGIDDGVKQLPDVGNGGQALNVISQSVWLLRAGEPQPEQSHFSGAVPVRPEAGRIGSL